MTIHISAAREMLDDMMAEPECLQVMHSVHQGLRKARWSNEYVDSIGQLGVRSRSSWPMEQVAAFATVHAMITSGRVAMVPVSTDGAPHPDKEREKNAAALSSLPHPFTASVSMTQNNADCDGHVSWSEPIEVSAATGIIGQEADGTTRPLSLHFMIPPGDAPLEIGSSHPSRTWMHLAIDSGAVARWPYGHSCLRLFVNLAYMSERLEMAERLERGVQSPTAQATLW